MKKLISAMLTLAAAASAYAADNSKYTRGYHRIYIEPDISLDLIEKKRQRMGDGGI